MLSAKASIIPPLELVNSRILTNHERGAIDTVQQAFAFHCKKSLTLSLNPSSADHPP
jgi:hypothetical protein